MVNEYYYYKSYDFLKVMTIIMMIIIVIMSLVLSL